MLSNRELSLKLGMRALKCCVSYFFVRNEEVDIQNRAYKEVGSIQNVVLQVNPKNTEDSTINKCRSIEKTAKGLLSHKNY